MKKILLIDAHPDSNRLTSSLVDAYKRGALQSGYDIRTIIIKEMEFNPNL
jgi:Putative NADPH-quinone reductase (modulator of drug activity B)